METTTLRMPEGMRHRLQVIAARESLRRGRRVTWAALVRHLIETQLLRPNFIIENETHKEPERVE